MFFNISFISKLFNLIFKKDNTPEYKSFIHTGYDDKKIKLYCKFSKYEDTNNTVLQLLDTELNPYTTISINSKAVRLNDDEIMIRDTFSTLVNELIQNNIIERPYRYESIYPVCKIKK